MHASIWKLSTNGQTHMPIEEPSPHINELTKVTSLGTADSDEFGDMKWLCLLFLA